MICAQSIDSKITPKKLFDAFEAFEAAASESFIGYRMCGMSFTTEIVRKKDIDKVGIPGQECYVSDISSELKKRRRSIRRKTSR